MVKPNQTVHITVKTPANPNPDYTIALFDQPASIPNLDEILKNILLCQHCEPKDAEFLQNTREEVMKALFQENAIVQSVARTPDGILHITLKENR